MVVIGQEHWRRGKMLRDYSKFRLTTKIINMTDRTIRMYEETSGDLRRFPIDKRRFPRWPEKERIGRPVIHYVFEMDKLEELRRTKRKLDDVAFVLSRSVGANNKEVTFLVWGKDMKTSVLLHDYADRMIPSMCSACYV